MTSRSDRDASAGTRDGRYLIRDANGNEGGASFFRALRVQSRMRFRSLFNAVRNGAISNGGGRSRRGESRRGLNGFFGTILGATKTSGGAYGGGGSRPRSRDGKLTGRINGLSYGAIKVGSLRFANNYRVRMVRRPTYGDNMGRRRRVASSRDSVSVSIPFLS